MASTTRRIPLGEMSRLGRAVYERKVRPALDPADDGRYVAIDVETEDYEVNPDDFAAVNLLRARHPDPQVWVERVGHEVAFALRAGR